ncbi:MAG TPA: hypothetical protein PK313_15500, partial [Myxococcota bacterium]|nr:hypothetical protein [Myxococcota bacterium]
MRRPVYFFFFGTIDGFRYSGVWSVVAAGAVAAADAAGTIDGAAAWATRWGVAGAAFGGWAVPAIMLAG